jgi:uncharacterized protein YndB with AHSA1/START domain
MTDPIVKTLDLPCPAAQAFDLFVNRIAAWWPLDTHSVSAGSGMTAIAVTIEPRIGGAVYETTHDGARSVWGEVLVFEEGRRLTVTWHPGRDRSVATRVDVRFDDVAGGRAQVTLTHSGWEALGDVAQLRRDDYNQGWDMVFGARFARTCVPA